jgi:hypothetical protein
VAAAGAVLVAVAAGADLVAVVDEVVNTRHPNREWDCRTHRTSSACLQSAA